MTDPNTSPAINHQNFAPASHAAMDDIRPTAAASRLQDRGSTITRHEFSGSDFHAALHPRRMFDKSDVDGGSGE
jgi:hypothetical protein